MGLIDSFSYLVIRISQFFKKFSYQPENKQQELYGFYLNDFHLKLILLCITYKNLKSQNHGTFFKWSNYSTDQFLVENFKTVKKSM